MPETSYPPDDSLSNSLDEWGRRMTIPPTPNIAARIRPALAASGTSRPVRRLPLLRWTTFGGLAAVIAVVALIFVLRPVAHAPAVVSADRVLARAASNHPKPGEIVHLVYSVRFSTANGSVVRPLNVWDSYSDGAYTTIDVQRNLNVLASSISAVKFVEKHGRVLRKWSSHPRNRYEKLTAPSRGPVAGQDGRLIASRVLNMSRARLWTVTVTGERTIAGHRSYLLAVDIKKDKTLTIAFDVHSYDLVSISAPGFDDQLVSRRTLTASAAPQLIVAYLAARSPLPAQTGSTTAY